MLKVVVLDGNAISRSLLTSVLLNAGYEVIGDSNITSAAVAAMIKLQPQLICIDIGDADDEGFSKIATIRAGLPKSLVFMVSSTFDPGAVQLAVQHGVHGFIVKPFNPAKVLSSIRNAVLKVAQEHRKAQSDGPAKT